MTGDIATRKLNARNIRSLQPDLCGRPSPDWEHICIKDLGHDGQCGWERPRQ